MPYKVTVTIDDLDHTTARGTAECAWGLLLMGLLHGTTKFEVTSPKTGKTEIIELNYKIDDDITVVRHMFLTLIASDYLTEEQLSELAEWGNTYLERRNVSTTDWEGWEAIIGQKKPKKFRKNRVIKKARKE